MVPVVFSPQRLDALKLFADVTPLNDPYILGIVTDVTKTLVNNKIDPQNTTLPLVDYLQSTTMFASRIDEHLENLWFNAGRHDFTARDLSEVHMLVISASRLLAMDINHVMTYVLQCQFNVHSLAIKGNVGEAWLTQQF